MIENGYSTLEVRADVHDGYNKLVDEKCRNMVWAHPGVTSWYKSAQPRDRFFAWRLLDYWKLTQHFVPEETTPAAAVTRQSFQVGSELFLPSTGLP